MQMNRKSTLDSHLIRSMMVAIVVLATVPMPLLADEPWEADPEMVARFSARRDVFNYDESKVPTYRLPDPLQQADGSQVGDAATWKQDRRPELMELFRSNVYGRRPNVDARIRYVETGRIAGVFDGKADGIAMETVIEIDDRTFSFPFVIFIPTDAEQPVPAVIHINNREFSRLEEAAQENDPFWPARTIVERGYATASFHTSDVDPDRKDGYAEGVRSFYANGKPPADEDWRSLSAWGWAASRILDHLSEIDTIDAHRVAVVGHSRGGKTALWAAAEDPRFAIAYSNNSGCGGAALSRRVYGETVGRITNAFPHWFCKTFSTYSDREHELPVDQHELIGLIAPRAVYVTSADKDLWADPRGEYASLAAAAPVFELLGQASVTEPTMPALDSPRVAGRTGYHIRTGKHNLTARDWNWFLDFADQIVK